MKMPKYTKASTDARSVLNLLIKCAEAAEGYSIAGRIVKKLIGKITSKNELHLLKQTMRQQVGPGDE